jgi:archaellum biogenesis ATPase FlaH
MPEAYYNDEKPPSGPSVPVLINMANVVPKDIDWLWYPYLAYGQLAFLDGDPGVGKSMLTLQIAACLSQGYELPDQKGNLYDVSGTPRATLLISAEDALDHTMQPRLVAMGANLAYIHVLEGWRGHEDQVHMFTMQHMDTLIEAVKFCHPSLIVIDPIQAYLGRVNMNQANQTRPLMAALARVAIDYHCAVICVRHPAKSGEGMKMLYRGIGSIDMIGIARMGLFAEQHPTKDGMTLMFHHKNNIGPKGRTQLYGGHHGKFDWWGASRVEAKGVMGGDRGPEPLVLLACALWLEEFLSAPPAHGYNVADLIDSAQEVGYTKNMLYKAKQVIGARNAGQLLDTGEYSTCWTLSPL